MAVPECNKQMYMKGAALRQTFAAETVTRHGCIKCINERAEAMLQMTLCCSTILKLLLSDLCTYLLINFWPVADTSGDSADHVSLYAYKLC